MDAEAATGESLGAELQEEVHHVGSRDEVRRFARLQSLLRRWTRALEGLQREVREDLRGRGGAARYEGGDGVCFEEGGIVFRSGVGTVSAHGRAHARGERENEAAGARRCFHGGTAPGYRAGGRHGSRCADADVFEFNEFGERPEEAQDNRGTPDLRSGDVRTRLRVGAPYG